MSTKTKETLTVISQEEIGRDIYSLWLQTDQMAQNARPGQFLSLYTGDGSKLLPRPISICEIDKEDSKIRLVYRVTGKNTGTEGFSRLKPGEKIEALGPLGNGFPLEEAEGKKVFLIGGGIGIPPMLETAKQLKAEKTAVLGYRDELFLNDEFTRYADVYVATEDGSAGKSMQQRRISHAGFPWRKEWRVESEHVLDVSANQKRLMRILRCITNVFVKMDRYS